MVPGASLIFTGLIDFHQQSHQKAEQPEFIQYLNDGPRYYKNEIDHSNFNSRFTTFTVKLLGGQPNVSVGLTPLRVLLAYACGGVAHFDLQIYNPCTGTVFCGS